MYCLLADTNKNIIIPKICRRLVNSPSNIPFGTYQLSSLIVNVLFGIEHVIMNTQQKRSEENVKINLPKPLHTNIIHQYIRHSPD